MKIKTYQIVFTVLSLGFIVIHFCCPDFKIDGVTAFFLALAVLPWLAPLFRSVELPGCFKVEFQELQRVEKKVEESGLVPAEKTNRKRRFVYYFERIAQDDPNLALAGLRIEIESRLNALAKSFGLYSDKDSLKKIMHRLKNFGTLSNDEFSALCELLPILNSAVHGAEVDIRASDWAMDFGPQLLAALDDRIGKQHLPELIERWQSRDGADVAALGLELAKSLIKSPKIFFHLMSKDDYCLTSWLESLNDTVFTLYESKDWLEEKLFYEYYLKLKNLMEQAASTMIDSEYRAGAEKVLIALRSVDIRHIC